MELNGTRAMNQIRTTVAIAIAAVSGASGTALAEPAPQWQSLLNAAIEATSAGECPAKLMEPSLKSKCERDQAAVLPELFAQMGSVQSLHFVRVDPSQAGPVEVYRVTFQHGESTWHIAAGSSGEKVTALWASDLSHHP